LRKDVKGGEELISRAASEYEGCFLSGVELLDWEGRGEGVMDCLAFGGADVRECWERRERREATRAVLGRA
jgi:hypothetical protein